MLVPETDLIERVIIKTPSQSSLNKFSITKLTKSFCSWKYIVYLNTNAHCKTTWLFDRKTSKNQFFNIIFYCFKALAVVYISWATKFYLSPAKHKCFFSSPVTELLWLQDVHRLSLRSSSVCLVIRPSTFSLKRLLLLNHWVKVNNTLQECSLHEA